MKLETSNRVPCLVADGYRGSHVHGSLPPYPSLPFPTVTDAVATHSAGSSGHWLPGKQSSFPFELPSDVEMLHVRLKPAPAPGPPLLRRFQPSDETVTGSLICPVCRIGQPPPAVVLSSFTKQRLSLGFPWASTSPIRPSPTQLRSLPRISSISATFYKRFLVEDEPSAHHRRGNHRSKPDLGPDGLTFYLNTVRTFPSTRSPHLPS